VRSENSSRLAAGCGLKVKQREEPEKHGGLKQKNGTAAAGRYMPGLDGLRALAVLAVIAYHLELPWAPGGLLGVALFFVLSGYLITDILLARWDAAKTLNLKDFWLRRARRLLPALFALLGAVLVWVAVFTPDRLASLGADVLAALFYASNWWLVFHQVSYFESFGPASPLEHLWSLAVEEQFYLLWPLLLGLGLRYIPRRNRLAGATVVLALVSAAAMALLYRPGLDPSRVYYGTDTRAFALLIGAALAMVWPSRRLSAGLSVKGRLGLDAAGGAGLLIVLVLIGKSNGYQPFLYRGGLLLFSVAAAILIAVLAHPDSRLGKFFGLGPLRWLGVRSYGIYLWHYPVIVLTGPAVHTGEPDIGLALGQAAASIVLAALSWAFIEKPIRYGKGHQSLRQDCRPRWWQKPLAFSGKVTLVSVCLLFSVLCLAVYGGTQVSGLKPAGMAVQGKSISVMPSDKNISQTSPDTPPSGPSPAIQDGQGNTAAWPEQKPEPGNTGDTGEPRDTETAEQGKEDVAAAPNGQAVGQEEARTGREITIIGDSVMLGVKDVLEKNLPGIVVDARIGRQMIEAAAAVSELKAQGKLGRIVIIQLGTNGAFTKEQLTDTLDALGPVEQIILLNVRVPKPWENAVNETLAEVARTYPGTKLVDWYAASRGHDAYFYQDGVHLTPEGAEAYISLIVQAVTEG